MLQKGHLAPRLRKERQSLMTMLLYGNCLQTKNYVKLSYSEYFQIQANDDNETHNANDDLVFRLLEQRTDTGNKMLCFLEIENQTFRKVKVFSKLFRNVLTCNGNGKYQSDTDPKWPIEIRL